MDDKKPKILLIDDQESVINLFITQFSHAFHIDSTTDPLETFNYLQASIYEIVIADHNMPNLTGIELLTQVRMFYPKTKRVLLSGDMDLDIAIESTNRAHVNLLCEKPWNYDELETDLLNLIEEKKDEELLESQMYLEIKDQILDSENFKETDDLLNLLIDLREGDHPDDFSNQFLEALRGMRSLAMIHFEFFMDTRKDKINERQRAFGNAMEYLTDMDVIANQYNQKYLTIYTLLIRSYLYLLNLNGNDAYIYFSGAEALLEWTKDQSLPEIIIEAIETFPLKFQNVDDDFKVFNPMIPGIELQIRKLFRIKIEDLVAISENLFKLNTKFRSDIDYLIVVKDEIPMFFSKRHDFDLESSLISGFVTALSNFLEEIVLRTGGIETITHTNGSILIHQVGEVNFVLFTSVNDIRYRVALRHFADSTLPLFISIPPNQLASESEKVFLNENVEKFFGKIEQ